MVRAYLAGDGHLMTLHLKVHILIELAAPHLEPSILAGLVLSALRFVNVDVGVVLLAALGRLLLVLYSFRHYFLFVN